MQIRFLTILFFVLTFACTASKKLLPDSEQLVIVTTLDWSADKGMMSCYERRNYQWIRVFSAPVLVGKKGMGIGIGIAKIEIKNAPEKWEGDLKAPAGIFKLGPAFGYTKPGEISWIKVPYIEVTPDFLCIDDSNSISYNCLIHGNEKVSDWKSCEKLKQDADYYKWGIFVQHNSVNTIPGKGSCIYIHIREGADIATAGCTALSEEDILKLMHWLDASKKPLLIQFPSNEYEKLFSQNRYLPKLSNQ